MQQASYLEGGPLMWMLPLYMHVNKKSDYDDDDDMKWCWMLGKQSISCVFSFILQEK